MQHILQCKLLISIILLQNKTEQKKLLLKCRLISSIKCEIQTGKNTNTSSFFTNPKSLIPT
jgi:hypothetical protein